MGEAKIISFLAFAGLRLVIQLAILVLAILAARRHKLTGLWFLVAAVVLNTLLAIANFVISSPIQIIQHDRLIGYFNVVGYFSYGIMLITLCGWAVLAFCRRKKDKPDA